MRPQFFSTLFVWALTPCLSGAAGAVKCPEEPLWSEGGHHYRRVAPSGQVIEGATSCAALTNGSCPIAASFSGLPCLVYCVASPKDCLRDNPHTPDVNPLVDPYRCTSCSIGACKRCNYGSSEQTCAECFSGFTGFGGADGHWEQCVIWNEQVVLTVARVLVGILLALLLLIVGATCIGFAMRHLHHRSHRKGSGSLLRQTTPRHDDHGTPLLDEAALNKSAVAQALHFSVVSSITMSALRLADEHGMLARGSQAVSKFLCGEFQDLGIGLQLFFNTQVFLIVTSIVGWIVALARDGLLPSGGMLQGITDTSDACMPDSTGTLRMLERLEAEQIAYANVSIYTALTLWLITTVISWIFYFYQERFISRYYKVTLSAEDYTLRLSGLPDYVTSERKLKRILERELRMTGNIHGVSICYDIIGGPGEERIEHMIEHLIEWDDVKHNWYSKNLATPIEELRDQIDQDRKDLEQLLQEKQLLGSGEAYVVFQKERDMLRVFSERCGISLSVFSPVAYAHEDQHDHQQSSMRALQDLSTEGEDLKVVSVHLAGAEPGGICWMHFKQPHQQQRRNMYLWMPLRMMAYIGVYALVAQLFYSYMIRPFQVNGIEGAEDSAAVKVVGKIVLLFNIAIQTAVMMDVDGASFCRVSSIDQITFVYNTVLLLVTNAYVLAQSCYQQGIMWKFVSVDASESSTPLTGQRAKLIQSARFESEIGDHLVDVISDQILMLYVIGEVANVLLPVVFYWVSLRIIFVWQLGGTGAAWFRRCLRSTLPRSESAKKVTVREAEKAQVLVPLLLWMEYTYAVIFPVMACFTYYIVTDKTSFVFLLLLIFAVTFYIWQRYFMLWLYGRTTYDSQDSYQAFTKMWGIVLAILPVVPVWWWWRLGEISETPFAILTGVLVFFIALMVYECGIILIDWYDESRDEETDGVEIVEDKTYAQVINDQCCSWWNTNPVYVLKNRYCPELPGHEVLEEHAHVPCWPTAHKSQGFFQQGKEFRHEHHEEWMQKYGRHHLARLLTGLK